MSYAPLAPLHKHKKQKWRLVQWQKAYKVRKSAAAQNPKLHHSNGEISKLLLGVVKRELMLDLLCHKKTRLVEEGNGSVVHKRRRHVEEGNGSVVHKEEAYGRKSFCSPQEEEKACSVVVHAVTNWNL
jgi:hypothetical protein